MSAKLESPTVPLWWRWALVLAAVCATAIVFGSGLAFMVKEWNSGEYSHGYLIPVISLWMVAKKRDALLSAHLEGDWWGLAFIGLGLIAAIIGELGTLYTVIQYAFLITIVGFVILLLGWTGVKILWGPLVYLAFMIPLPDFIYRDLSSRLQLLSSSIGVTFIRAFGISVFIEGNIIDLGNYKLQVAEACSGLRYLFPLLSFGFLCAYIFAGRTWEKIVLLISTIPIAILMNSFRIAVIGVLTESAGPEAAEGFLHLFEGWVIFVLCLILLFGEAWLLLRLSGRRMPLAEAFGLDIPRLTPLTDRMSEWVPSPRAFAGVGLLVAASVVVTATGIRSEISPTHTSLVAFPMNLAEWRGHNVPLEQDVLRQLRLDDYFNANFVRPSDGEVVNLYIAYYDSQRKGASVHSPRSCIPGGGWEIDTLGTKEIGELPNAKHLSVNRLTISKGTVRQIAYYWFQQRGRSLTDEYLVKWYIFQDAITINRTDGALVRLMTPLQPWEHEEDADARLAVMLRLAYPQLTSFIPD